MIFKQYIKKASDYMSAWHDRHLEGPAFLYLTSVVIGVLSGAGAAALKSGISFVISVLFDSLNVKAGNWLFMLLPVVGITLAVLFTKLVVHQPLDHASERIADDLSKGQGKLSPKLIFGSIISCSLTLGMGGSAGAESPVAYTGAAIGSNMGRAFKLSDEDICNIMGCGAAAGIAGIYMAPIGGMMFAFEILRMKQSLKTALALTFSCLISALTCYILMGCHTDVSFVPAMRFDTHLIPYVVACGVFCGVYSLYYSGTLRRSRRFFGRFSNIWVKALVGGLLLAGMLFLFPSLYGEGYGIIGKLMDRDATSIIAYSPLYCFGKYFTVLMLLFVVLLLLKPFATSATNDSGGVGGDFTPTFFCGGVAGFLFAAVVNHYFALDLPYALFAFFGMAAVMSGAQRAPLMAIFIASEMTGMYGFILPLTIAALASFVTTMLLGKIKIFRSLDDNADVTLPQ